VAQTATVTPVPTGAATLLFSPDAGRLDALVANTGAVQVYVGTDPATSDGSADAVLQAGEVFPFHDSTLALYGAVAPGTLGSVTLIATNDEP